MKTRFNIYLFSDPLLIEAVKNLVLLAALCNGSETKNTLSELQSYFDVKKAKNPAAYKGIKCHILFNSLFIEETTYEKCDDGQDYCKEVISHLQIEEVEVSELVGYEDSTNKFIDEINNPDDLKDIL